MQLSDFKVLTFDVYGTLIDWESGMIAGLKPLTDRVKQELNRDEILQAHALHESTQQHYTPAMRYQDLLPLVYRRLAEQWGVFVSWQECLNYGQSVKLWPAFPDSAEALKYLKQHYKLVVLTNTDNDSFMHSQAKLQSDFDGIYTAEDVGSYKPAARNFEYMLEKLATQGIEKHEILHTAESMFHDHEPANRFGLTCCHIYRRYDQDGFGATMTPGEMPSYQFRFNSMADLVEAHRTEMAS
ncbi:MAG: haloacid dehalogenase type II [Thiolinea sp.]